jgi:hypothetical protein
MNNTTGNKIVPIVRNGEPNVFASFDLIAPTEVNVNGVLVNTAPLAFDTQVALLSVSQIPQLLDGGTQDQTDEIDPAIMLSMIYLGIMVDDKTHVLKMEPRGVSGVTFVPRSNSNEGSPRVMKLDFHTAINLYNMIDGGLVVENGNYELEQLMSVEFALLRLETRIYLSGLVDLETGVACVYPKIISLDALDGTAPVAYPVNGSLGNRKVSVCLLGYELDCKRVNPNRRPVAEQPKNEVKEIIPVWREESAHQFVERTMSPPKQVIKDGVSFLTAPLAFNKRISLLGISQVQALLDSGYHDQTDSVDPSVYLSAIYLSVRIGICRYALKMDITGMPATSCVPSPTGSFRKMVLNFETPVEIYDYVKGGLVAVNDQRDLHACLADECELENLVVKVHVDGEINLETSDFSTTATINGIRVTKLDKTTSTTHPYEASEKLTVAFDNGKEATIELLGYDLHCVRTNYNLRPSADEEGITPKSFSPVNEKGEPATIEDIARNYIEGILTQDILFQRAMIHVDRPHDMIKRNLELARWGLISQLFVYFVRELPELRITYLDKVLNIGNMVVVSCHDSNLPPGADPVHPPIEVRAAYFTGVYTETRVMHHYLLASVHSSLIQITEEIRRTASSHMAKLLYPIDQPSEIIPNK